jgi:hypothetical protein
MKQISIVLCLACALGGCFFQAPAPAIQPEDMAAHPAQIPTDPQPTQTGLPTQLLEQEVQCGVEAKCLAKMLGTASRAGKNLNLKLDSGSTKLFTSTDDCETVGESCVHTSLIGYLPSQHLFVLSAKYYESSGSILVSRRTGAAFRIEDAVPHFSPDGKRFVVVAVSEQDGINQVAIYSTSAFPPVQEWSHIPKSWSTTYEFVGWSGNDRVKLRTFEQKTDADISRTSTSWKLTPADG